MKNIANSKLKKSINISLTKNFLQIPIKNLRSKVGISEPFGRNQHRIEIVNYL